MHIVLGATGHVGSAVAQTLLDAGEQVAVLTRDKNKADEWQIKGAQVAITDVSDVESLRRIFASGERLFLLNPPANPSTDTATEERRTRDAILAALAESGLKKIVAESTYGAQPGDQIGDLGVLYEMEQTLAAQPIPTCIIRAAYYMSNWDAALEPARTRGIVPTLYPPDFPLPMVAPLDIGHLAARLLTAPAAQTGLHEIEGPRLYTPTDVATAFTEALGRPVEPQEIPRTQWRGALQSMGFSKPAATSFINMTALTLENGSTAQHPTRGQTSLQEYISALVARN